MKHIASVSFGKDSTAMLFKILENNIHIDEVVFYDTGMEFQAIYRVRDYVKGVLKARSIPFTQLQPQNPFLYDMLEKPVKSKQKGFHNGYGWCGGVCRWGTSYKTSAIDGYCRNSHVYVGIAADEQKRLERLPANKSSPIADLGMTEKDCLDYCRSIGISWKENGIELYNILDRVSCWCCCNKNRKELKNMYLYLPDYWERLKDLQKKMDRPMKRFTNGKYGEYGNVFKMEEVFKKEIENAD